MELTGKDRAKREKIEFRVREAGAESWSKS
jgi:hypothetical protein